MVLAEELQDKCGVVQPPWETAPYGVVSLLAMLDFYGCTFWKMSARMGILLAKFVATNSPENLSSEDCAALRLDVEMAERECVAHDLSSSAMQCKRILQFLGNHDQKPER